MRFAPVLCLIALTVLGSGCAPINPNSAEYEQGFHDGYAACQREERTQRERLSMARDLKINNRPTIAKPVETAEHGRILGFREPIAEPSPIATIETIPSEVRRDAAGPFIINGTPPPAERARIIGILSSWPTFFERARILDVQPAPAPTRATIKNVTTD